VEVTPTLVADLQQQPEPTSNPATELSPSSAPTTSPEKTTP
jgi:hypothetical protein